MSTPPVFYDKVTMIPADVLNTLCKTVYGPLAEAVTVPEIFTALGLGNMAKQSPSNVVLTGGTLDGVLIGYNGNVNAKFQTAFVAATPTAPTHAANKQYVDAQIAAAGMNPNYLRDNYLALAGGVMTGAITLAGDPTIPLHPATKRYVDQVAQGYVTTASLNETVSSLASLTYVDSLLAQQANRQMYHDSFILGGATNTLPLRAVPAGDVIAWQGGIPIPASQVSVNRDTLNVTFTFNPSGAVDLLYFSATGSGSIPSGYLSRDGGTMTGPLILARDPALPLEAATKSYVDAKTSSYSLPIATAAVLGGVKVGDTLTISDSTGVLDGKIATATTVGMVRPGSNLTVAANGTLSVDVTKLAPASVSTLGVIQVGAGLTIDANGVLSTEGQSFPNAQLIPSGGNAATLTLSPPSGPTLFAITLDQPTCSISFADEAVAAGKSWSFTVMLRQGTGVNKVTWPANVRWEYDREPTLAYQQGQADIITFMSNPFGSGWLGFFGGSWFNAA